MNLRFRQARPEDADAIAPFVYSSGPVFFDYVFTKNTGVPALEFLRCALQWRDGELGWGAHYVATMEDKVVAAGAAYAGDRNPAFALSALRRIPSYFGLVRSIGIVRRGLQVERLCRLPGRDLHYISHLGVAPELRGRGIGEKLMNYLLDRGRTAGLKRVALDVAETNPRAEALYTRMGFCVTGTCVSNLYVGEDRVPSIRGMEMPL